MSLNHRATVSPLSRKLEQRDHLSAEEKRVLDQAVSRVKEVAAGKDILPEGARPSDSTLLLDGFAGRYKVLADGRRQITAIQVTGDFVDLHSFILKSLDHGVAALTRCKIALVPHEALRQITEQHPHLTRLLWLNTLIDAAIHREWIVAMGRRPALAQVAHLFCELYVRLRSVGLTNERSYHLPLTQAELGDTLGLSAVHVNRVIQELRSKGMITWRGNTLEITNWDALSEVAEFNPAYLYLADEPR